MKTLLALGLCVSIGLSAFGQTAVRSSGGAATNLNLWGVTTNKGVAVRLGSGALGTMYSLVDTNGTGRFIIQGHNIYLADTNGNFQLRVTSLGVELPTGPITGDGSGLTNLSQSQAISNFTQNVTFQTNVTFLQNVTFSGKATLVSNVFLSQLSYATNHAAVTTLRLGCNYQAVTTNNNVAYTGFDIPAEYGVTNIAWASVIHTNTSGSLKTLTFAGCIGDTTVYVTNQTAYTVVKYPGMGTNVVSRPLN